MTKEERLEKKFWKDINKLCKKCSKSCKQSSKVLVIDCPGFTKMNGKEREIAKAEERINGRSQYDHLYSCKSGKIDKLMAEGKNVQQITMLLHITLKQLHAHLWHLRKYHNVKVSIKNKEIIYG